MGSSQQYIPQDKRFKNGGVMRITDLLDKRSVMLGAAPSDKKQALEQAISLMVQSDKIADEEAYRQQAFLQAILFCC